MGDGSAANCAVANRGLPMVTICVLTYGDYLELALQVIESIRTNCSRSQYRLVVAANAVGCETLDYLQSLERDGHIDRLVASPVNINKCTMMRRMFEGIETEFVWWFDDDSYVTEPGALGQWLEPALTAPEATVM